MDSIPHAELEIKMYTFPFPDEIEAIMNSYYHKLQAE